METMKSAYLCQICLGNRVDHVLVPCGHTMCGDCLGRMQSHRFFRSQQSLHAVLIIACVGVLSVEVILPNAPNFFWPLMIATKQKLGTKTAPRCNGICN
jgi:hypothetical protein